MSEAERIDLVDRAPLTEKQQNVYESIMQYQRVNGYAPTIREICVIRQIKRCPFRQIKTGLSEHLTME